MIREKINLTEKQYLKFLETEKNMVIDTENYVAIKRRGLTRDEADGDGYEFILRRESDDKYFKTMHTFNSYGDLWHDNLQEVFPKKIIKTIYE